MSADLPAVLDAIHDNDRFLVVTRENPATHSARCWR
jgi:hypothetical protein